MPIIKSAKKRVNVTRVKSVANAKTKRTLRDSLKSFQTAITGGKKVEEAQSKVQSAIDTAVKKGIISKNKAARKKSQLNAAAKAVNGGKRTLVKRSSGSVAKASTTGKATKTPAKPVAKKTPAKKATPAKKPATKKATPKKSPKK